MAAGFMRKGVKMAYFLLGAVFLFSGIFPQRVFSQETKPAGEDQKTVTAADTKTIPDALRRPDRGEAPRYPQDVVIGELGQGQAPDGAYRFARDLLEALVQGDKTAPVVAASAPVLTENLLEQISSLQPQTYRIGGGKREEDGNVSFLVRFLGTQESITGELFIHQNVAPAGTADTAPTGAAPEGAASTSTDTAPTNAGAAASVAQSDSPPVESDSGSADIKPDSTQPDARWLLDDLVLEEKRALTEIKDDYRYDFSPYERFF